MDDLMQSLRRGGCVPLQLTSETCVVDHPQAADEREARVELGFFLKAWLVRNPDVRAEILD